MRGNLNDLPDSVAEIASVIGRDAAIYLIGRIGSSGSRPWRVCFYVPKLRRLTADHVLVRILGWHQAKRLCRHFGGEILQPSNCSFIERRHRDVRIAGLRSEGLSSRAITDQLRAEGMRVSHDVVKKVVAGIPPEETAQPPMQAQAR